MKCDDAGLEKLFGNLIDDYIIMMMLQEIQSQANLFQLLVHSLCPSIFGHEMVKAGLILGLFGSGQKFVNDKNRIPVRGDPHILVVGDPGLGKSQVVFYCSCVSVSGKTRLGYSYVTNISR